MSDYLSDNDLSISKVYYDPTRKYISVYYVDYENVLYQDIPLQEDIKKVMQAIAELDRNRNAGIVCISYQDWYRLYSLDLEYLSVVTGLYRPIIPTPLMLYDFRNRMYDIPKEKVFEIWYRIYKRMDHTHGMWLAEIIPYVFPLAPPFQKPETDTNSKITIYRGIGTKSLPPDKAISWSTDPTNALDFATRHGEGTGLVIAEIEPEKIIWFAEGARNENEILIYPGTAKDIKHADFILPSKETLHKLVYPNLGTFLYSKNTSTNIMSRRASYASMEQRTFIAFLCLH